MTPVLESLLNKFASLQICNFIKKRLQHRCFPMKFARTPILKNICELLLVCVHVCVRARVCVCVFILFHLLVSSGCTTSVTYVRYSDQRSFVVSITSGFCQVPSSKFPNLSYFTSKDGNSSQQLTREKAI